MQLTKSMLRAATIVAALMPVVAACYGVPEDTRVGALRAQAWGGVLPDCVELKVDLDQARVAAGTCEAVDVANGVTLPADVVEAVRAGIDDSEIRAENVEPDPGCGTCPTRAYRVMLASESAGTSQEMRIIPSAGLLQTLAPLGAP